jgi:hypothetical protein
MHHFSDQMHMYPGLGLYLHGTLTLVTINY